MTPPVIFIEMLAVIAYYIIVMSPWNLIQFESSSVWWFDCQGHERCNMSRH